MARPRPNRVEAAIERGLEVVLIRGTWTGKATHIGWFDERKDYWVRACNADPLTLAEPVQGAITEATCGKCRTLV